MKWKNKCKTVVEVDAENKPTLLNADDKVILAEDKDDANYTFQQWIEEFELRGLEINTNEVYGHRRKKKRPENEVIKM